MERDIRIFKNSQALAAALGAWVLRTAAESTATRGRFMIAISGGSALDLLAEGVRTASPDIPVDWIAWHVFWADERCVPLANSDSNSAAARKAWLDGVAIPSRQIVAVEGTRRPADAAQDYERRLAEEFGTTAGAWPRFDLVVLGMGADGHTASLFPGHSALAETGRWVVPVSDAPKPPPERVTLTLPAINHARQICFVATGANKAPALAQIFGTPAATGTPLPAARVRPSAGPVHWFIDEAAAGAMTNEGVP